MRGIAEQIDAVVWFNDLRGFTRITVTAPEQVIPLLNDYSDAIFLAIYETGAKYSNWSVTARCHLHRGRPHARLRRGASAAVAARRGVAD